MTANICTLFVLFELLTIVNYSLLIIIMCCTHEDWSYTQLVLSVREMVNNNNVYMRLFSILLYSSASSRAKVCVYLTELHSLLLYMFYKASVICVYCSTMSDRLNILVASATHRRTASATTTMWCDHVRGGAHRVYLKANHDKIACV